MRVARILLGSSVLLVILPSFLRAQESPGAAGVRELIFPMVHSAFLEGSNNLQTTFSILNLSNTTAQASIVTYQDDGTPARILQLCSALGIPPDLDEVELNFEIPAAGGRDFLTQADNQGELPGFSGWARVRLDRSLPIQASAEVRLRTTPEPCIVLSGTTSSSRPSSWESAGVRLFSLAAQLLAVEPATGFRARAFNSVSRRTGFSIVNPSDSVAARVTLEVFNLGGERIGSAEVEVPPLHRLSRFVTELVEVRPCPECSTVHYNGTLHISSDVPIAVGGLVVLQPDGLWVSLPVSRVPAVP